MTDLWHYLKTSVKPIYLYGMGNGAEKILDTLDAHGLRASGVFASDGFVRKKTFRGFELKSFSEVISEAPDCIVLVAFGTQLPNVIENIRRISTLAELYAPDVSVFGSDLFDLDYCKKNASRIERVYSILADNASKHTFKNLVYYKLTGDVNYLFDCESSPEQTFLTLVNPTKSDIFVDLGAYRGDTVCEFLSHVQNPKSVFAVEPDPKTFKKLISNVPDFVTCVNAAVTDLDGTVFFDKNVGRGSHLSDSGVQVPSVSVDGLLKGKPATYIKMDVEGAEKQAIYGARSTIANFKPRLNIAAYHRAFDIIDIPEQVLSINPDYKVYLRHFPYVPAWDTNYYFV